MQSKLKRPPVIAQRLLSKVVRSEIIEEVLGDLDEKFYKTVKEKSILRAQLNYWFQTLNYLRSFAIRKPKGHRHPSLMRNNIKISWRHLKNQPLFSSINIGGLTLAITACILITLYIQHELNFDTHLHNTNTYRLFSSNNNDGVQYRVTWNQPPLADVLRNEVPEIENIARVYMGNVSGSISSELKLFLTRHFAETATAGEADRTDHNESFFEEGIIYADPPLFQILEINVINGNRRSPLTEPSTIVITQRKAEKFFPNEDPIGKLIVIGNDLANPLRIDAVIENPPANSHLQYDFIISLTKREFSPGEQQTWGSTGFYNTYVQLHNNADLVSACAKMTDVAKQHMRTAWSDEFLKEYSIGLQPIKDIHLYSADMRGPSNHGDILYVWIFGAIATFILIIACINFINLSTARSANRAKEVGLRKTVGSSRAYIINQFLTESVIFSVISFSIACVLAWLLLPQFNIIAGTHIEFPWNDWKFIPTVLSAAIILGIIAGLYPSFYLSHFRPIEVLKGNISRGAKNSTLRSTLVIFQFTVSIILIIATTVIYNQIDFMLNRKPGFDKEQVLLLHGTNSLPNPETLKQELLRIPGVQSATISEFLPVTGSNVKRRGHPFWVTGGEQNSDTQTRAQIWGVDHDYIKTMGMKIIEGRDFDPNMMTDSTAIIINQQMVKDLALEDPIGKQISDDKTWNIIGVVENFNFETLRSNIRSLSLTLGKSPGVMSVRIAPGETTSTVEAIERTWHQFVPDHSIRYTFLDDSFNKMYDDVRRIGNIFTSFAVFAMIVACLGLFALSAFMIEQRSKEISIRLLFGATVQKIFSLLTADFLKLIFISIVIAIPIAVWLAKQWLEGFHYRIELTWGIFVITGAMAVAIAMMTVTYQSVRAGLAKPVDKLRRD